MTNAVSNDSKVLSKLASPRSTVSSAIHPAKAKDAIKRPKSLILAIILIGRRRFPKLKSVTDKSPNEMKSLKLESKLKAAA